MAASRPNRASGTAARRISGSPRSPSPAAGTWHAKLARDGAPAECSTITREIAVRADEPPRPRATRGERLAAAQYLEPRDGKPVLRMDREAVRRAARGGAVVEGAARGAARSIAQFPVQPSGSRRGRDGADHSPRLRRPSLLLARVFRLQDGAAVRLLEMLARRRRQAAEVPRSGGTSRSEEPPPAPPEQKIASGGPVDGGFFGRPPSARVRRPGCRRGRRGSCRAFGHYLRTTVADGVHSGSGRTAAERRQHRLLSRAAQRRRRCAPAPCTPIRTGTCW